MANLLIQKGANVNCQGNWKNTPLHMASRDVNLELAKLFIQKGANIICQGNWKSTPLYMACSNGHLEVTQLLLQKGAISIPKASDHPEKTYNFIIVT